MKSKILFSILILYASTIPVMAQAADTSVVASTSTDTATDPALEKAKKEYEKISYLNKISDENAKLELSKTNEALLKLTTENKLILEADKKATNEITSQLNKLKAENDLKAEQIRALSIEYTKEKNEIDLEIKRMEFTEKKYKNANEMLKNELEKLQTELNMRDKKDDWKKHANKEPIYVDNPFDANTGTLTISDRRIALNGTIVTKTADYVTERIEYYNNISTSPIFIVINSSPGGSVMAGYRIVKAMQSSKAPVYVVVKSFAASMAAVITTLAQKSFVYPNAILLHHQMSTMNWGNMTQLKEQLEIAREWEKRLDLPVVKKIGMTLEEFRKKMYEKNSDGDWEEFGDNAVKYKWADYVVDRIEETGILKNPDFATITSTTKSWDEEKLDEKGNKYVSLPRLEPFDFYFIYNPDRYYR